MDGKWLTLARPRLNPDLLGKSRFGRNRRLQDQIMTDTSKKIRYTIYGVISAALIISALIVYVIVTHNYSAYNFVLDGVPVRITFPWTSPAKNIARSKSGKNYIIIVKDRDTNHEILRQLIRQEPVILEGTSISFESLITVMRISILDPIILLVEAGTNETKVLELQGEHVFSLKGISISRDGRYLITLHDASIKIWDISNKTPEPKVIPISGSNGFIAYSAESRYIIYGDPSGLITVIDIMRGLIVNQFTVTDHHITSMVRLPFNHNIISVGTSDGLDRRWNILTGERAI